MDREIEAFWTYREQMNAKILNAGNLEIRRFFGLDEAVYRPGALDAKTKELLGLVASTMLRCDDCIVYHVDRCVQEGLTPEAFTEAMAIVLVVGGSITIPHVRHAFDRFEKVRAAHSREGKG